MFQSSQICCCQNFCSPARLHLPPHRLLYSLCSVHHPESTWVVVHEQRARSSIHSDTVHSSIHSDTFFNTFLCTALDSSTVFPHCRTYKMLLSGRVIRHENRNLFPKDNLLKWLFGGVRTSSNYSPSDFFEVECGWN
jgi:hypothetical protein